jgi:hypothetical protein
MQVTLEIPDALAAQFTAAGKDPAQVALETLAVDGYRTQRLSESEVREIMGYGTRMQVHALLKEYGVYIHYSEKDFEQDMETSRSLRESTTAA